MILKFDGKEVDYFEKFPRHIERVGISLSGGADSALILYLLAKEIQDRDQPTYIYPIHGYDVSRKKAQSWKVAEAVIGSVKYHLRDWHNIIKKPHIFAYDKNLPISKEEYHKANYEYMTRRHSLDFVIRGVTQGMPNDDRPLKAGDADSAELTRLSKETWVLPFGDVDKKFIAHCYNELNLDRLLMMTSSCIADQSEPCEECWWCKEKYWAFGHY